MGGRDRISSTAPADVMCVLRGQPEEYNLPTAPGVPTVRLRAGCEGAAVAAGPMLVGTALAFLAGPPPNGTMKLRFALLVVGLPLLALGGEGLYHSLQSRQQVTETCDQFVRERPAARWVRLTGCELDYDSPGYREADGKIAEIFFPVRAAGQPKGLPAPLLAATTDPGALATVQATIGGGRQPDQEAVTVMMLRVITLLRASREIEGVARAGLIEHLQTRRLLQSFPVPLDPGYDVVDLHARPSYGVAAAEAGVGLSCVLLFLAGGRRRRVPAAPVAEADAAPATATPLPAMLLLNLGKQAGVDAIEHAPPLGTRAGVIATLQQALPGISFDQGGSGTVSRPDHAMTVDIGVADPVWTATLRASGDGAVSAVKALAEAADWRVFAPKRGVFVDTSEVARTR